MWWETSEIRGRRSISGGNSKTCRHSKFRRRNQRQHQRLDLQRRRAVFERLERRDFLAGDSLSSITPLMSLELDVVDPSTLRPLLDVHVGDEFAIAVYARDLRASSEGVFAAYFDLEYSDALVEVSGPIDERGAFTNGATGSTEIAGLADEIGGFVNSLSPPDESLQLVAAIPFQATRAGDVKFSIGSADLFPNHDSLLFGDNAALPVTSIDYGSLDLSILDDAADVPRIEVLNDDIVVASDSRENVLDVLSNDVSPLLPITILAIDAGSAAGEVTISPDGGGIIYSPPPGFSGIEVFQYSATNDRAEIDQGTVTVRVQPRDELNPNAAIRLAITDLWGNPVAALTEGDAFQLQVGVEDLRTDAQGVFAAYTDLEYTASLVDIAGAVVFDGTLTNGTSGTTYQAGLIDDAGGFQMQLTPVGGGVHPLFRVPMVATRAGRIVIQSSPADKFPHHEVLLYDENAPVDPARILFERVDIQVGTRLVAVDDFVDLAAADLVATIPALENDFSYPSPRAHISAVQTDGLRGIVRISDDGQSLIYQRPPDFIGTEQFQYILSDGAFSDSADVTVQVRDPAGDDDSVSIRLAITDVRGDALGSIAAGELFQVRAYVRDARSDDQLVSGIFAAYLDLLYDSGAVAPETRSGAIEIAFGESYQNVKSGSAASAGVIDEVGAVQTGFDPLGSNELLLFTATFQANAGRGANDFFAIAEDGSFELDVLANDAPNRGTALFRSDPADISPENEILYYDPPVPAALDEIGYGGAAVAVSGGDVRVVSATRSRHGGTVSVVDGGRQVSYTPPANFFGADEFTYSLGAGPDVLVQVMVNAIDDAPQGTADSYVAPYAHELVVDARHGVLANDQDVDGDALVATLDSHPSHGRVVLAENGAFTYLPEDGFTGIDTFSYQAADGSSSSNPTRVQIEVVQPPVRVRLETTDIHGQPVDGIGVGEAVVVRAYVQDTRDDSRTDRGVGAAYVDLAYDAASMRPTIAGSNRLGFAVTFGSEYQNATTGNAATAGVINDVGGLQSNFAPIGREEEQLFAIQFDSLGPRAVDDSFIVSMNSQVNLLDVLRNEQGLSWEIAFQPAEAGNSPQSDIVLFEPPQAVTVDEIQFLGTSLTLRNSDRLVVQTVGTSRAGGSVAIDAASGRIRYAPPVGFVGQDSINYTIGDELGRQATGSVQIEVSESWTNELLPNDANSDSLITTGDALVVINDLNSRGPRQLPNVYVGHAYFDVNRDGHETALDVLAIINALNAQAAAGEAESIPTISNDPPAGSPSFPDPLSDTTAVIWVASPQVSLSDWRRTRSRIPSQSILRDYVTDPTDDIIESIAEDVALRYR